MIQIIATAEGCILPVRAQPGARRNGIVGEQNGALKVAVSVPPEKGKANEAIQKVLCDELNLRRSQVQILSGATSRDKRFMIHGVTQGSLAALLLSLLEG